MVSIVPSVMCHSGVYKEGQEGDINNICGSGDLIKVNVPNLNFMIF